jgi:hypothetical protein
LLDDIVQVFHLSQPRSARQLAILLHLRRDFRIAAFLSTVMVRGFTVCGCAKALRKNRFAASASRLAEGRKSMVWPRLFFGW